MLRSAPFSLIALVGLLGCKTVQRTDVVGTWVVTDQARNQLPPEVQQAFGTLVVNADGTFDARQLPEQLQPTNAKAHIRLDSGGGTWVLQHEDAGQQLELEFHKFESGDADSGGPYGFPLDISRRWSTWELYYFLGDPDNAPRVALARR
jgi:hypothetical protein